MEPTNLKLVSLYSGSAMRCGDGIRGGQGKGCKTSLRLTLLGSTATTSPGVDTPIKGCQSFIILLYIYVYARDSEPV